MADFGFGDYQNMYVVPRKSDEYKNRVLADIKRVKDESKNGNTTQVVQQNIGTSANDAKIVAENPSKELAQNSKTAGIGFAGDVKRVDSNSQPAVDSSQYLGRDSAGIGNPAPTNAGFGFNGNGVDALAARYDAQKPFVASTGGEREMSAEQRALLRQVTTPHAGAQNGQLTANQINVARGILGDFEKNNISVAQEQARLNQQAALNEANKQHDMQKTAFETAARIQENALNRAQADRNSEAVNKRADAELALRQTELGFKRDAAARDATADNLKNSLNKQQYALTQQYINAKTDNERNEIARQLQVLQGDVSKTVKSDGFNPNAFQKITREVADPKTGLPMKQEILVDLRTGKALNIESPEDADAKYAKLGFMPSGDTTPDGRKIYVDKNGNKKVEG
jgi:hypothetical protein|nr:MAG TPA: hypothetical protein [Caudoviricetes sp.]